MKKCTVEGCDNKHHSKGYCQKHYNQMKYHGHILKDKEKPSCQVSGVKENGKGKWLASIIINKKPKHLGTFDTYEEAVKARIKAEKEYFGDFAPTNN